MILAEHTQQIRINPASSRDNADIGFLDSPYYNQILWA